MPLTAAGNVPLYVNNKTKRYMYENIVMIDWLSMGVKQQSFNQSINQSI